MLSGAPLKAVLFDVGGPIADERPDYLHELEVLSGLIERETGHKPEHTEIEEAMEQGINSYSPSVIKAILWKYLEPDCDRTGELYREALRGIFTFRDEINLTEGVKELIPALAGKYKLALAGNQPGFMREKLERTGLMRHFASTALSADLGLKKPDTRFFLEICSRIDESPESCCMIGDRLDNDIYPANVLGMRTIWLKVGPYAAQRPRIPEDVPDATIERMSEVAGVIEAWERV